MPRRGSYGSFTLEGSQYMYVCVYVYVSTHTSLSHNHDSLHKETCRIPSFSDK